jgi:glycerophosphoryl diester phosphodiesterase
MNKPKVIAHRGGAKDEKEENTLLAFRQVIEDGGDGFECDVALTKDDEPIIIHKPYYKNIVITPTGKKVDLATTKWAEIKNEGMPHLYDVLDFVRRNTTECYIEPKANCKKLVAKIVNGIEQYELQDKVHIITFYYRREILKNCKELNPNIKTSVILINPMGYWPDVARTAYADMLVPGWKVFNFLKLLNPLPFNLKEKIKEAHSENFLVYSGIADNEGSANWLCDLGVDGIYTNKVKLVVNTLEAASKNHPA